MYIYIYISIHTYTHTHAAEGVPQNPWQAEAGAAASPAPSLPEAPVQWPEATVAASDSFEALCFF